MITGFVVIWFEDREILANKDIVFVEGGNTFFLLKCMKASGFKKVLEELMKKDSGIDDENSEDEISGEDDEEDSKKLEKSIDRYHRSMESRKSLEEDDESDDEGSLFEEEVFEFTVREEEDMFEEEEPSECDLENMSVEEFVYEDIAETSRKLFKEMKQSLLLLSKE